jgi:hypothetical protein
MTYIYQGRQYVVLGVRGSAQGAGYGAQLIAFALPRPGGAPARGRGAGAAPAN